VKSIHLSPDVALPLDCVTQTFAVLGKRGSGKTNTAGVLAEGLVKAGLPVVYVDPVGVVWGLRHSRDGKRPGLPVIILGGEHADVPLEETGGAVIADFVIEHRAPVVLDLGLFSKGAQRRFMVDFAERLYHKNRTALHVMLDECDTFIPQRIDHGGERLVGAINDLVRKGRARGLGVTLISQRPALISKDVLTQAETLIAHRMTGPQDRDAIERWIEHNADSTESDKVLASLQQLRDGEAWVWSPSWLKIMRRTQINLRETFDSSATPKAGERAATPKQAADVDLGALREQLAATIEKTKADDPRELKKVIYQLNTRVTELKNQIATAKTPEPKVIEKPVLIDEQIEKLATAVSKLNATAAILGVTGAELRQALAAVGAGGERRYPRAQTPARTSPTPVRADGAIVVTTRRPTNTNGSARQDDEDLDKGQTAVLQRIVQLGPLNRSDLGTLTGYKRSTRNRILGELSGLGLITTAAGQVTATDEGRRRCPVEELPTGDALMQWWLGRLDKGQAAVLQAVAAKYPDAVERESLEESTTYKRSTRNRILGELAAAKLVITTERGMVRASEKLFDN